MTYLHHKFHPLGRVQPISLSIYNDTRGGFRLSRSTPLVTEITILFSENVRLTQETRPLRFLVIQQIAETAKICRSDH